MTDQPPEGPPPPPAGEEPLPAPAPPPPTTLPAPAAEYPLEPPGFFRVNLPGGPRLPSVGRIVRFVLDAGPSKGENRAALVAHVWDVPPGGMPLVDLQVFTRGPTDALRNDQPEVHDRTRAHNIIFRSSVRFEAGGGVPGTWHWPPFDPRGAIDR